MGRTQIRGQNMAIQEDPSQYRAAPSPDLAPAAPAAGGYSDGGRAVEAGRGWDWIAAGYGIFRPQAGIWILLTVIFVALLVFLRFIPMIGGLLTLLLAPVLVGGLMAGCQALERGADLELAHLFAGFRRNTAQLMLLGVIAFGLILAAMIPMILIMGVGIFAAALSGQMAGAALFGMSAVLAALITLALLVPVNMALWFAPALVMLQDQTAVRAIGQSFLGCLKNIVPFLLYGVIVLLLAIVASIPFGLGWLVLAPVAFGSVYVAYRDIFLQR